MNTLTRAALIAASLAALPVLAIAQNAPTSQQNMPMGQGQMPMGQGNMGPGMMMDHGGHMGAAAAGASTKAFEDANAKMHKDMAITFSGNADVDFARGMIPHHQGAIDMARIELQYGKDPELKKLAEDIIKAQESEIAFLKAWIEKNAK
jgi:uncharacterized protein (DUF305 family)